MFQCFNVLFLLLSLAEQVLELYLKKNILFLHKYMYLFNYAEFGIVKVELFYLKTDCPGFCAGV